MLVFKRALSVALSVLLACPVSVFAANEKKAHARRGFIPTANSAERDHANLDSDITPKTKPNSKSQLKSQAKQQSKSEPKKLAPGAVLSSLMPKSTAKRNGYDVVEVKGKGNRLKSRTVTRGDFREIIVDEDGDGFADVYEVTRGAVTAKANYPDRGRFTRVEFTQKHTKGEVKSLLFLDPVQNKYVVTASSVDAYKRNLSLVNSGAKAGAICTDDLEYLTSFEKLLAQIQEAVSGPKANALECKLEAYQDLFFDKSCDNGEFKESKSDMIKGLSKLMASRESKNPSQYLQCLEDNGFGYHAAQIQSTLGKKLQALKEKMASSAVGGDSQFANNSCVRVEKIEIYKDNGHTTKKKIDELVDGSDSVPKLFTCSTNKDCNGSHKGNQVTLCAGSTRLSGSYGTAAPDAYGSLMMHELLHNSGMNANDEPLIDNIQNCCAPSKYSSTSTANACATVKQRSKDGLYIASLNQTAGYRTAISYLAEQMGKDEAEKYLANLAIKFRDLPEGQAALRTFGTCQTANQTDEVKLDECRSQLMEKVGQFAVPHTEKVMCEAWKNTNPEFNCQKIVSVLQDSLKAKPLSSLAGPRAPIIVLQDESQLFTITSTDFNLSKIELPAFDLNEQNQDEPEVKAPVQAAKPAKPSGTKVAAKQTSPDTGTSVAQGSNTSTTKPVSGSDASTQGTAASSSGSFASQPSSPATTAQPSAGKATTKMESEVRVSGEPSTSNSQTANGSTTVAATNQNTSQSDDSETGSSSSANNSGTSNMNSQGSTTGTSTYVPSSSRSGGNLAMPTSAESSLGRTDNLQFKASPVADTLLAKGADVLNAVTGTIAKAAPANAQTIAAQNIVRSPAAAAAPASSGSGFSSWASSNSSSGSQSGNRGVAARGSSSGGSGGGSGRTSSLGLRAKSSTDDQDPKSQAPQGKVAKAEKAPESEGSTDDASAEGAEASEKVEANAKSAGAQDQGRGLAAVTASGSAGASSWKVGTFHTRYEATKFLVTTPASRIIELASKPNSAFEKDLAKQQIGIRKVGGGKPIGFSRPTHQVCGDKIIVIERACK